MKRIFSLRPALLISVSFMAGLMMLSSPAVVFADSVTNGLDQLKNGTGNAYPKTIFDEKKTASEIFGQVISIALGVAFAVSVIMVIWGGYSYITSAGNEEKATEGRKTVLYALIGMVIVILSFVIVRAVVNFIQNGSNSSTNTNTTTTTPTGT